MATHGTLDVVVHLHRFRNVDLFSRGIYMIRLSCKTKGSDRPAIPYSSYSKPSTLSTFVRSQEIPCSHAKSLPPAQVVDATSEFSTRAFVIKYRDERLELNEGVQFQLLVPASAKTVDGETRLVFDDDRPLQLKLDLLMAELEKPGDEPPPPPGGKYRGNTVAAEKPSATPTFSRIATQTLRVTSDGASRQVHAYFPATFSAMHFCQLDLTVHAALLDLKFRKRAYARDGAASLPPPPPAAGPEAFHELLFPGRARDAPVDVAAARATHHVYLQPMLQSLGAAAAALRNMCADDAALEAAGGAGGVPSSRAVAGVMALIKKPYLEHGASDAAGAALTPATLAASIETDVKLVARRLFLLWGRFVALLPQETSGKSATSVAARLQRTWLAGQRRWWGGRLSAKDVRIQKLLQPRETSELRATFDELRAAAAGGGAAPLRVFDEALLQDPGLLPVAASHVYLRRGQDLKPHAPPPELNADAAAALEAAAADDDYRGPHLIVMQHGWYASSFDMRLLRAYALLLFPRAIVLSPQSNEDNSGGSMGPMGQRLAHEVHNFIKHRCDELGDPDPKVGRLSFIGHSAGSMIVRTALTSPVLRPYLPKLHAFVSLSSSHCGNVYVPSTLVAGGMWALQHLHQSTFMDELQLVDRERHEDAFMFRLSKARGFEYFKYVVLVGSLQDSYVPTHTAQAAIPRPAETDRRAGGDAYRAMATNLLAPVMQAPAEGAKATTLIRLTMDYKFAQTSLDTVIGRAAHLAYIDSSAAVLLILFSLYNLFQ